MARSRGRRRSRRGGGRRRGNNRGGNRFRINIPAVFHVSEGKTENVTAQELFPDKFWKGVPWRLLSVRVEATAKSSRESVPGTKTTSLVIEPCIFQIRLHSAEGANVEGVASLRWTVGQLPTRRTIRMRNPNVWKEDEQRTQDLVALDNLAITGTNDTTVFCLCNFLFEFGPIAFNTPQSVRVFPASDHLPDDASTSSAYSVLNM